MQSEIGSSRLLGGTADDDDLISNTPNVNSKMSLTAKTQTSKDTILDSCLNAMWNGPRPCMLWRAVQRPLAL